MIEIENITKQYDGAAVVDDVSLVVAPRTVTVIVGTSGSGKTTLLRMINRLVEPSSGTIRIDGDDVTDIPGFKLRRQIGYAIQGHGLFPHRTVAQNIATVPELIGWDKSGSMPKSKSLCSFSSSSPRSMPTDFRMNCQVGSSSVSVSPAHLPLNRTFC